MTVVLPRSPPAGPCMNNPGRRTRRQGDHKGCVTKEIGGTTLELAAALDRLISDLAISITTRIEAVQAAAGPPPVFTVRTAAENRGRHPAAVRS
jgi:hypothetical protein